MTVRELIDYVILASAFLGALLGIMKYAKSGIKEMLKNEFKDINDRLDTLESKIDTNEADRIRTEIEHYYHICLTGGEIDSNEKTHIDNIYRKYHEELKQNGEITHEYNYIIEYYEMQFKKTSVC